MQASMRLKKRGKPLVHRIWSWCLIAISCHYLHFRFSAGLACICDALGCLAATMLASSLGQPRLRPQVYLS